jgi:hypothetical protein
VNRSYSCGCVCGGGEKHGVEVVVEAGHTLHSLDAYVKKCKGAEKAR